MGTEDSWSGVIVGDNHVIKLDMPGHPLYGQLPPETGNLAYLEKIDMKNNSLTGNIPPEIGKLGNLTRLELDYNQLTGTIPPELGGLSKLEVLRLGNNRLTGNIPDEFENLESLRKLDLSNNRLRGEFPLRLGYLPWLSYLWAGSNRLSGSIPWSFKSLRLIEGEFSYNALYAENGEIKALMDSWDPSWYDTQTVPLYNFTITGVTATSISLSWTPIPYSGEMGGYDIYYDGGTGSNYAYTGSTAGKSTRTYTITGLRPGITYYIVARTRTDPHGNNSNTVISDYSAEVYTPTHSVSPGDDLPPFGSMDLPVERGAPYSGSFAVTGWALDDVEVTGVYISCIYGGKTYDIGEAVFLKDARPDIEQAYPTYPANHSAGWGYMLLSHFLPNQGNGAYTLRATAVDSLGHRTLLGSKSITVDNAGAQEPFGAIDSPAPCGAASGAGYQNSGWVLTPMPARLPEDGSTIKVFVNGVEVGTPVYNGFRQDIYDLFPGYANRGGAWAYFNLDTTAYKDGIYTIHWIAEDDAGNTGGIGSRYFSIQNGQNNRRQTSYTGAQAPAPVIAAGPVQPRDISSSGVGMIEGFSRTAEPRLMYPGEDGRIAVNIRESQRLVVQLSPGGRHFSRIRGYLAAGNRWRPLPVGSTLDQGNGIFYWLPGPCFLGDYPLVFIMETPEGEKLKKVLKVSVTPGR